VIHLAFILNPLHDEQLMHDVDVRGSKNVLDATAACEAEHLVVASSTSAFGAFPDNPPFLSEADPLGREPNYTCTSDKYEVEELIKGFREDHPEIKVAV
jgi:UDP-glucose 4-epimerase